MNYTPGKRLEKTIPRPVFVSVAGFLAAGDRSLTSYSERLHQIMAMVCPQCRGSFSQRLDCPQCGVRLVFQDARHGRDESSDGLPANWQQTPWGRLVVGLLLAQ